MTLVNKILFFIPSLGNGGAEKQVLRLANALGRNPEYQISVAVSKRGKYEHELHEKVRLIHLLDMNISSSTLRMVFCIRKLRKLIGRIQPDKVISVLNNANIVTWRALLGIERTSRPAFYCCVQNNLENEFQRQKFPIGGIYRKYLPLTFRSADRIIAISEGVKWNILNQFPDLAGKVNRVYNIGYDEDISSLANEPVEEEKSGEYLLVACGRLVPQKNYPMMVMAFQKVVEKYPKVDLWILGEGNSRKEIERMIHDRGLEDKVRLLGFKSNPFKYYKAADIFILSSDWEGFGNVIVEAMATGTPVVATDCPYGPSEIITNDMNGYLVDCNDHEAMAERVSFLIENQAKRQQLMKNAIMSVRKFHIDMIVDEFEEIISP